MTILEIMPLLFGSTGLIGIFILIFKIGKFAQRLENIDKRLTSIDSTIVDINHNITEMKVQLGILETRVEERTLRVIMPHQEREMALKGHT